MPAQATESQLAALKRVCVIGWGNVGRRDDGAAVLLCEQLAERLNCGPGEHDDAACSPRGADVECQQPARPQRGRSRIEVHICHQLAPELVEVLEGCALAIFVDANAHAAAGAIEISPLQPACDAALDTHALSPAALLALGRALGRGMPAALQIGLKMHERGFGDELSPQMRRQIVQATAIVLNLAEVF